MYRTIVLNHLNNRFQNQSVTPVGLMTQVRDNIVVVFGNPADSNGHGNYAFYQYPIDSTESCRE